LATLKEAFPRIRRDYASTRGKNSFNISKAKASGALVALSVCLLTPFDLLYSNYRPFNDAFET